MFGWLVQWHPAQSSMHQDPISSNKKGPVIAMLLGARRCTNTYTNLACVQKRQASPYENYLAEAEGKGCHPG